MYKFSFTLEKLFSPNAYPVKTLKDIAKYYLNVPDIVLSCEYYMNKNGKDIYIIRNTFGGNFEVGYCDGNIQ